MSRSPTTSLPELEDIGSLVLDDDLEGLELPRGLSDPDQLTIPLTEGQNLE